jgi:hypothetical protein
MKNRPIAAGVALLLFLGLSGCASVNEKALRLFSARAKAVAIVNGQVLNGVVDLLPDRTGTASMSADGETSMRCAGQFRYTGSTSGTIDLRCSDGSRADMQFSATTEISGYAYGQSGKDDSSLTYGFSDADALAMLRPPAGKKLVLRAGGEGLEIQ